MKKLKRYVIRANVDAPWHVMPDTDYEVFGWTAVDEWSEKCLVDEDFVKWFMAKGPEPRYEVFEVELKPRKVARDKFIAKSRK